MENKNAIPKWDVALAALVREVYNQRNVPLSVADLNRLCTQYSIRFDDMLVNMFELCIHNAWRYQDAAGHPTIRQRRLSKKRASFRGRGATRRPNQTDGKRSALHR